MTKKKIKKVNRIAPMIHMGTPTEGNDRIVDSILKLAGSSPDTAVSIKALDVYDNWLRSRGNGQLNITNCNFSG